MPGFTLQATSASVTTGINPEGMAKTDEWRIVLVAAAQQPETLSVTTGENLDDFLIYINLKRGTNADFDWLHKRGQGFEKAIGALYYFAGHTDPFSNSPPTLIFEIYVAEEEMTALLDFARHGRFPSSINLDAEGLEYDWRPDGSGMKWDTATKSVVPLTAVSFSIPISDRPPVEVADPSEPKTPVGSDLIPELKKLARWQQWTLYVLVALGAILLLR